MVLVWEYEWFFPGFTPTHAEHCRTGMLIWMVRVYVCVCVVIWRTVWANFSISMYLVASNILVSVGTHLKFHTQTHLCTWDDVTLQLGPILNSADFLLLYVTISHGYLTWHFAGAADTLAF